MNNKVIVVTSELIHLKPVNYIFDLIFSILGIEYEILSYSDFAIDRLNNNLLISYGCKKPEIKADYQIHIYQSELFGDNYMKSESMPKLPLKRWNDLPIIYEGKGNIRDWVIRNGNTIETNIDIIASSFFMLSCYEEYLIDERDQHDRFPASASIAYKEGFLARPIVNDYIELLWQWIDSLNLGFKRKKLWGEKDFVACLTHDIDKVERWNKKTIRSEIRNWGKIAIKKRKPISAIQRFFMASKSILISKDPYWNFNDIIKLEGKYGFYSTFYFLANNSRYSLKNEKIHQLIIGIKNSRYEVGLHGGFGSHNNYEMLMYEKNNLNEIVGEIYSTRQHYLCFDVHKTFAIYEKLNIKCDVTLGYAQHEGFRSGFCLPYHPYNIKEDRPFNIYEIPLTIMDGTFGTQYKNLSYDESWQNTKSLLEAVKKAKGCIVFLSHNSYLDKFEHSDYLNIYKKFLEWIAENNGKGCSAIQIIEDWKSGTN